MPDTDLAAMVALAGSPAGALTRESLSVFASASPVVVSVTGRDPLPASAGPEVVDVLGAFVGGLPNAVVLVGDPSRVPSAVSNLFDVCLTDVPDPPRPWVADPTPVKTAHGLLGSTPLAALGLVSVLRVGREDGSRLRNSTDAGLAVESAMYSALLGGAEFRRWRAARPVGPKDDQRSAPAVISARTARDLTITLNRPARHNALDTEVRDALVEALAIAAADPTLSVTMAGRGPSLCSGGDLDEFGTVGDPPTAHAVRLTRHPGWWMDRCRDRLTVIAHGACIGAGAELAAFAGRVVAHPDAWFALPEVGMGLIPGAGGTVSIPRRIGRQRCAWLALTGGRLDAATARQWGLVDEIG